MEVLLKAFSFTAGDENGSCCHCRLPYLSGVMLPPEEVMKVSGQKLYTNILSESVTRDENESVSGGTGV